MPARDIYHKAVRVALQKDGWTITHDPFKLRYGIRKLYADLGAEKLFAASKDKRQIVVEVKSFTGASQVEDLQEAFGAYAMYRQILAEKNPDWMLYLAVPSDAYRGIFSEALGRMMLEKEKISLVVFRQADEVIERWIP
jgi:hypothetical protein